MRLDEVEIEVKNSGLLEVPNGKEVDQLPQEHFQKLIDKKGYEAVIRGLTNLEVWNKNKDPKLSQWASSMADKLKVANKKDESYSSRLDEVNTKLAKKIGGKVISGLKRSKDYAKTTVAKSADTARNAIVAGAVAPVGAGIAQKYNAPKKKEQKFSSSDVAALAAALKKSESFSDKLENSLTRLNSFTEEDKEKKESGLQKVVRGAAKGAAALGALGAIGGGRAGYKLGYKLTGGMRGKVAGGLAKVGAKGVKALTTAGGAVAGGRAGATLGGLGGAVAGGVKHAHDKAKSKNESLIESLNKYLSIYEESSLGGESPKRKRRELTPEQKLRRQERRKLRRQLEKQGIEPKKAPRSGSVKTIKGDPVFSQKAMDTAKQARESKHTVDAAKQATNVTKSAATDAAKQATKTQAAKKTISNTAKQAANKTFKKSQTFRKLMKKSALKGGLKGAAITAGIGAAGLAAKKIYDKNKK